MPNEMQNRVMLALLTCLRPLARVLLRSGVNYRQFAEVAKVAFLEECLAERDGRGRTANTSRVAVRTGISRKEVARIRQRLDESKEPKPSFASMTSHSGHAALTLQLWHSDARFTGDDARPLDLPFAGQELSFTSLVRSVGGDIPPGAVRAELVSAGAIVETENGLLKALKRYFVPSDKGEDLIVGLERIVYPVLEGLARNVGPLGKEPFVQRLAYSDRILPAAVPLVRQIAQEKCEEFLHSVDDLLCANERSVEVRPEDRTRIGVGVFYFEGGPPD